MKLRAINNSQAFVEAPPSLYESSLHVEKYNIIFQQIVKQKTRLLCLCIIVAVLLWTYRFECLFDSDPFFAPSDCHSQLLSHSLSSFEPFLTLGDQHGPFITRDTAVAVRVDEFQHGIGSGRVEGHAHLGQGRDQFGVVDGATAIGVQYVKRLAQITTAQFLELFQCLLPRIGHSVFCLLVLLVRQQQQLLLLVRRLFCVRSLVANLEIPIEQVVPRRRKKFRSDVSVSSVHTARTNDREGRVRNSGLGTELENADDDSSPPDERLSSSWLAGGPLP
jgi:hypothetical protein